MNQAAIEPRTHARRSDPITSHLAAEQLSQFAGSHCDLILSALKQHGPMTCDEIAEVIYLLPHQINKRTADMHKKGTIKPNGEIRLSMAGRFERVWVAL